MFDTVDIADDIYGQEAIRMVGKATSTLMHFYNLEE